ncbi:predicted protein [Histoplasma capsulatum G186AR]|uniref:Uncharacterized protein n=1 Tax=Ajellomyces capsulatus (strain G186AR / H82 / ATCC MYA-2454 / RMSCC 2432) TaxID=447093 RepID=C0NB47_AJECG|nr:uncharacterized protein HCBG_00343 [Histoplasma capsulatum G186AR]EEH10888.1 predicted protein [Histoplasma capsulatum G186AR]
MPSPERTNNQTESARQTSLIQTLAHTLTVLDHARDFLVLSPQQDHAYQPASLLQEIYMWASELQEKRDRQSRSEMWHETNNRTMATKAPNNMGKTSQPQRATRTRIELSNVMKDGRRNEIKYTNAIQRLNQYLPRKCSPRIKPNPISKREWYHDIPPFSRIRTSQQRTNAYWKNTIITNKPSNQSSSSPFTARFSRKCLKVWSRSLQLSVELYINWPGHNPCPFFSIGINSTAIGRSGQPSHEPATYGHLCCNGPLIQRGKGCHITNQLCSRCPQPPRWRFEGAYWGEETYGKRRQWSSTRESRLSMRELVRIRVRVCCWEPRDCERSAIRATTMSFNPDFEKGFV